MKSVVYKIKRKDGKFLDWLGTSSNFTATGSSWSDISMTEFIFDNLIKECEKNKIKGEYSIVSCVMEVKDTIMSYEVK